MNQPIWLDWAMRIQSIAQNGLAYCQNPFDVERYHQLRELAAEIIAHYTDAEMPYLRDLFAGEQGYATPKVDIRGVVFHENKILLVKELADGRWTLPGGWVDVGETPSSAVEREVWEESGYQVKAARLLAVFDRNLHGHPPFPFHTYKLFVQCDLIGGEAATSVETGGAEFFAQDQIPPLSLLRTTPEEIDRMFAHLYDPTLPAEFD